MPRYNITLSASNGECRPQSRRVWAVDDDAAVVFARRWIATLRHIRRDTLSLDTWEVWQGDPPYTKRQTVAAGEIVVRR